MKIYNTKALVMVLGLICSNTLFAQFYIGSQSEIYSTNESLIYSNNDLVNKGSVFLENGDFLIDAGYDNSQGFISYSNAKLSLGNGGANSNSSDEILFNANEEINSLVINKLGGTATVVEGKLSVRNSLIIEGDGNLEAMNSIRLKSDANQTAQVPASQATGIINLEVERFIPEGQRAFRLLSSPVTTSTSIYENWQEEGTSPTGFGTHITGDSGVNNGFDGTATNNPSLFRFDNTLVDQSNRAAWQAVTNTHINTLNAGIPYRIFIRGDRTIDLTSNESTATETTLRARGELFLGDYSPILSAAEANFSFIGNPYQATVNFNELNFSGDINTNFIYVWDAQLGERGGFVTVETSTGDNTVGSTANEFIQPGQAFFIRNNLNVTTPPSLTFTEASKDLGEDQLSTFSAANNTQLNLQLTSGFDGKILDAIGLRFNDEFSNKVTDADAGKMGNTGESFALVNSDQLLSIEQRQMPTENEELQLFIHNYQNEVYAFQLQTEQWDENFNIFIKDAYLDELTPIEPEETYAFTIDSGILESVSSLRFSLVFSNETLADENFEKHNYSVYPNPTKEQFYVSGISDKADVEIYDLNGRLISTQHYNHHTKGINVEQLHTGVYVVKIKEGKQESTKKLIKQ